MTVARCGRILRAEGKVDDGLLFVVVKDVEILGGKIMDVLAFFIGDDHVDAHDARLCAQNIFRGGDGLRGGRRRRGCRSGLLSANDCGRNQHQAGKPG